ncbi:MAG: hypothetical protein NTV34_16935, partial [Proteobacteria bacterium]|nr:hypothetical protein [Pseudomonadota bacterium]
MLWFFPQKRILSLVFGFIHGPIYDEWIVVDSGVVVGRLALIFLSLSVVQYLWSKFNKSKSTMTWRILGSTGVILWFSALFSSSGGHGKESLRALLPQEERVGFMVVHFATGHAGQQQRMRVLLKEAHF